MLWLGAASCRSGRLVVVLVGGFFMLSFLKHKFSKKNKVFASWGAAHVVIPALLGVALSVGLVVWHLHTDQGRVLALQEQAVAAAEGGVAPVQAGKVGGGFSLINQDGKIAKDTDFAGKYLMIYFGYTYCPDMCPTGLQSMSRALDMLKDEVGKVQPLFITVDPARDTPQRLKEYDSAFHPSIIGLTGSAEQIAAVAKEYQVYYEKGEGDQDYEVAHSSEIYLMNPAGALVATFEEEVEPRLIVEALKKDWGEKL